jgi:GNAT superfamily N-acetyltransferase
MTTTAAIDDFATIDLNLRAAMRFFGRATGSGEIANLPGTEVMFSGLNYGVFNIAMLDGAVTRNGSSLADRIGEAARFFKTRTPRWSFWLCEDLVDAATRKHSRRVFGDFGMRAISHPPGMIADGLLPQRYPLPEIEVEPVRSPEMFKAFTELTSLAFEIPYTVAHAVYAQPQAWKGDYKGHVALVHGVPVAIVAVVIAAQAIGVYSLATHPSHRRCGFAEALLRIVIADAQKQSGLRRIVLQSTEIGHNLYRKMGFRDVTRYSVFLTN